MTYEAIRARLTEGEERDPSLSESELLLFDAVKQLTVALESDLTQIKAALSHVAWLLESRSS